MDGNRRLSILNRLGLVIILLLSVSCVLCGCNSSTSSDSKLSFSDKIEKGYSINMLVCGDSLGGATENNDWCMLLADNLKTKYSSDVNVTNVSMGGTNVFGGYTRINALPAENTFDLIIFCYGQNDTDDSEFSTKYEAMLQAAITKYPDAQLICILESSQKDYTNKIKQIIEVCEYYGIPYADMIEAFGESGMEYDDLSSDGIHPNEKGCEIYANKIVEVIQSEVLNKKQLTRYPSEYLNSDCSQYKYFRYISVDNMNAEGDKYSIEIADDFDVLGIDRTLIPGEYAFSICYCGLDNKEVEYDIGYKWEQNFKQRHIDIVSTDKSKGHALISILLDSDITNSANGIVLTSENEFDAQTDTLSAKAVSLSEASLSVCNTIYHSIINDENKIETATSDSDESRNYNVYIYPVDDSTILNISSNTIGSPESITRYLFSEDENGNKIIKASSRNIGGWSDKYSVVAKVPKGAKFLLVTSQGGSIPTVAKSVDKSLHENLAYVDKYWGKILNIDGIMEDSNNYTVFAFRVTGLNKIEINTNSIGNENTIMRFAYYSDEAGKELVKKGSTNTKGWDDKLTVKSNVPTDAAYLLVTCQNGTLPDVIAIDDYVY
ncbi:MAG: SGNH/GDSL hydrolase family protein [Faecalibacterium sp.]